jgi:hypothetical protein
LAVDPTTLEPVDDNVLRGAASIENVRAGDNYIDVARYGAIGLRAFAGAVNRDSALIIGGPAPEYESCPGRISLEATPQGYVDTLGEDTTTAGLYLAQMPCSWDLARGGLPRAALQYRVFNEFAQTTSTTRIVEAPELRRATSIDSGNPAFSIFGIGVQGTPAMRVDIAPVSANSGLLVVAFATQHRTAAPADIRTEVIQPANMGARAQLDAIFLDVPECPGDCLGDGRGDEADLERLTSQMNGCPCAGNAAASADVCNLVSIGNLNFFPFNQCYAADLDQSRCLTAGELTRSVESIREHQPLGCPP